MVPDGSHMDDGLNRRARHRYVLLRAVPGRACRLLALGPALLLGASALAAQEPIPEVRWDLPAAVAEEVVQRLNDPDLDLRRGDVTIAAGESIARDLGVVDGGLVHDGTINGDVLVVNGDATFATGSRVDGDVLIVGGQIVLEPGARVTGEMVTYAQQLPWEERAGRIRLVRSPGIARPSFSRDGRADFLITTGRSYNRVEGLPISFGPRVQTAGSNPFRLQALAIYRTESGLRLEPDEMGYFVRAEQYLGGYRNIRVGIGLHSVIDPIEDWQMTDLESGLATFIFHKDFRDHYEREGWNAFVEWQPRGSPVRLHLENRWERHSPVEVGGPWSVLRNNDPWRPQPAIAAGSFGSLILQADLDSREPANNPASGWFARGRLEQAYRVDLARPAMVVSEDDGPPDAIPEEAYGRFTAGQVDVRKYNRIDASSRLNFRLIAGGSLTGSTLPPQRQHALGGEGSLPGYPLFAHDCQAREFTGTPAMPAGLETQGFFPRYGCDAFALFQAELRGKLAFRFRWDAGPWREESEGEDRVWDFGWDMSPDWALFVDAGRGWSFDDRDAGPVRVDVGAGILLDRLGLYAALPLTGGSGINVFLRLGPRF